MAYAPDPEPHLDPTDWDEFARESHRALDEMIAYLKGIRDQPVWQQAPENVLQEFTARLPAQPKELHSVIDVFNSSIKPYATGNLHPLFMGWVHGAGTPLGMLAEMLAAGLNANCGGRNHIGLTVERQITRWAAEMFRFPADASGIFVTGTSAANLLALLVARTKALGVEIREKGLRQCDGQLTAYTSDQVHACVIQAAEVSGLGSRHLRCLPVDDRGAIRIDALTDALAEDRRLGFRPFLVVASAGTVNTGAFDDLSALATLCREQGLWFHVDGAFGALCALSPQLKHLVAGIEQADSVAFDFHKWAQVPYDAGFLLVRDPEIHRRTFANPAAYLSRAESGLAAGGIWPCDLGLDLSRGFRALKTWFTFQVFGTEKIAACIEHTCRLAKHLEARIAQSDVFETCAPVALNIVCFGLKASKDGELNKRIVLDLHNRGLAAPSVTTIGRKAVIRAAIVNHRTNEKDIDRFVEFLHHAALRAGFTRMKDPGLARLQSNAAV